MPSSSSDDQRFLELLQRWQSGDFTRQDEQALYNLAESDDFRREAMEGFMALPEANHADRLAALRKRLPNAAQPRARALPFPQIMAVAAALLVLTVAIWFFPRAAEKSDAPMAQTSEAPVTPTESAPPMPEAEPSAKDGIAQVVPRARPEMQPATGNLQSQEFSKASSADDQAIVSIESKEEAEAAPPVQAPAATTMAPPPSVASGPPGGGDIAASKAKTMPAKPAARIAADSARLAWNETEKKSDMDKLRKEVRNEKAGPAQSEPAEGWVAFGEYLRQNARLPAEARDHNVSGSVRLRFTVNANGDPQNFVVLHPLGYGCDEEAKRLVQNWPWIRGQQPEVTVEVKFVR